MSGAISRAHSLVGFNPTDRPEDDFYPTPRPTTEALLRVETFNGPIWEPAAGDGAIMDVFDEHGYNMIGTDITPRKADITPQDYLLSIRLFAPNVVTNPPFKLLNQFIQKTHELNPDKWALLAKLQALETIDRTHLLEATHLTRVWIFRARQTTWRNGQALTNNKGMIAFCWLIWEKDYTGKPTIGWI